MQAIDYHVAVELIDDLFAAFFEPFFIGSRPPILDIPLWIVFTALVIEAVGHFVSNHRPDSAIVNGVVGIGIKERRLKNSCGKGNLVSLCSILGIDGWRTHPPLGLIDRFADLRQLALSLKS